MDIKDILQKVASGALRPEEAEALLRKNPADWPYEEMGFAKLDTDRKARSGFAEVVYCQGKSDAFIGQIFKKLYETEGEVFGTRASPHQYELVKKVLPSISYEGPYRMHCCMHRRHCRYISGGRSGPDGGVLRKPCGADL